MLMWLEILAYTKDRLRLVDRTVLLMYVLFLNYTVEWVMALPALSTAQAVLAGIVSTVAAPLLGFYNNSGKATLEFLDNLETVCPKKLWCVNQIDNIGYLFDRFRIIPTAFIIWFGFVVHEVVVVWAFGLENPTTAQAGFAAAIGGLIAPMTAFYVTSKSLNSESMKRSLKGKGNDA